MPTLQATKGRNPHLVSRRNEKIIIRYYYWREIQRRRMDDVIFILSHEEFFLHESTLRRIISGQLDKFKQLKEEKVPEKRLPGYEFN